MRWPARVNPELFVTAIACGGGGTSRGGTSTTWTGSSGVRPAARQPDGSRSLSARHYFQTNWYRQSFFTVHAAQKGRFLSETRMATNAFSRKQTTMHILGQWNRTAMSLFLTNDEEAILQSCWLLGDPSAIHKERANGVSGKPKIKSILHDVLHVRVWSDTSYRVCVYPKSINGVNEIKQHAISFTLFGTLVIFTMICDSSEKAPNRILSTGPRLRRYRV